MAVTPVLAALIKKTRFSTARNVVMDQVLKRCGRFTVPGIVSNINEKIRAFCPEFTTDFRKDAFITDQDTDSMTVTDR